MAQINANDNPLWSVEYMYKEFYQGRINCDEYENKGLYLTSHLALIILEGYIIALINTVDCIFVFDSHAGNNFGIPGPNGIWKQFLKKIKGFRKLESTRKLNFSAV